MEIQEEIRTLLPLIKIYFFKEIPLLMLTNQNKVLLIILINQKKVLCKVPQIPVKACFRDICKTEYLQ